jgi:hypothetical protein
MKSAEDRHRFDAAYVLDGAMDRSVFAKRNGEAKGQEEAEQSDHRR